MIIWLEEFVMQVFLWLLQLTDGIVELFNSICGIDDVLYAGESVNIIESTLTNSTINSVFWCIIILAVGLACIFTIVAVIKNMITSNKSLSTILGKFFMSILGTVAMVLVVVLGIMIANELLQILSDIFRLNTDYRLSSVIFNACAGEWINGFSINDFNVNTTTVADLFGSYDTVIWFIPTGWQLNGMLDPSQFFYAPAIVASVILAWNLLKSLLAMARRIFEIVFCYFCMPVAMSTLPLDNGERLKNWTAAFLSKILLAFGCVLSVNIFTLLLPVFTSLTIPGAGSFENAMLMLFLIVGGAMVIPAGQHLFVRIFAVGEDRVDDGRPIGTVFRAGKHFAVNATLAGVGAAQFAVSNISGRIHRAFSSGGQDDPDSGAYSGDGEEGAYVDPINYSYGDDEPFPSVPYVEPSQDSDFESYEEGPADSGGSAAAGSFGGGGGGAGSGGYSGGDDAAGGAGDSGGGGDA
ncbi:MAG: hypothetical protein LUD51_04485 [Clostridia bacterium]|nr:hypothetical protein [Clostridia bacterium]